MTPLDEFFSKQRARASYVLLDAGGAIVELGGPLPERLAPEIEPGSDGVRVLTFLEGLLPLEGRTVLRGVEQDGVTFDAHLIPRGDRVLVALLDVGDATTHERRWRQSRNAQAIEEQHRARDAACLSELARVTGRLVLKRVHESEFEVVGDPPGWFLEVARNFDPDRPTVHPDAYSPFLANFLTDAEVAWTKPSGFARSGPWTEPSRTGERRVYEATAVRLASGAALLAVDDVTRSHARGAAVLQAARELSIRHEALEAMVVQNDVLMHCIVHDLNSPLASIVMTLSGILEGLFDDQSRHEVVELALRQAEKQRDLIDQILEVFRAEHGTDDRSLLDVVEVVRRVAEDLAPLAAEGRVRIETRLAPHAHALADPLRLARVAQNLLANAIRHAPENTAIEVEVATGEREVRVEVKDRGSGVPDDLRDRLFEKLQQGASKRGKLGLGLYFCRLTLERWGGAIGYTPREGGGAVFWFRIPAPAAPR